MSKSRKITYAVIVLVFAGFFISTYFETDTPIIDQTISSKPQISQEELDRWKVSPGGKVCVDHPDWSHAFCDLIAKKSIALGMTKDQVELSIGEPDNINTTSTTYGSTEQWVYGYDYVYFTNGVVDSVQQHK